MFEAVCCLEERSVSVAILAQGVYVIPFRSNISVAILVCALACSLACMHGCVLACLLACLLAYPLACVPACVPACVLACVLACLLPVGCVFVRWLVGWPAGSFWGFWLSVVGWLLCCLAGWPMRYVDHAATLLSRVLHLQFVLESWAEPQWPPEVFGLAAQR